jgi:acylphosphatase
MDRGTFRTYIDMVTKHLIITGRVQGVGFRNYVEYKARQFHITGWVRNRLDGSVEAVVQGTAENVEALIQRARRGPPKAFVSGLAVSEASGDFTDFVTCPTE